MATAVENLIVWFNALNTPQQQEVLEFLYNEQFLKSIGISKPPKTALKFKGRFTGPAPKTVNTSNTQDRPTVAKVCPTCNRPI